jgi:hypothetical protein
VIDSTGQKLAYVYFEDEPGRYPGCEGIVSKRLGSPYRSGRVAHWVKIKNPKAPAVPDFYRGL